MSRIPMDAVSAGAEPIRPDDAPSGDSGIQLVANQNVGNIAGGSGLVEQANGAEPESEASKRHGVWCRLKTSSLSRSTGSSGAHVERQQQNHTRSNISSTLLRMRGRRRNGRINRLLRIERELKKQAKQLETRVSSLAEDNEKLTGDVRQRDEHLGELKRKLDYTEAKLDRSERECASWKWTIDLAKFQATSQQDVLDCKQDDVIKMATRHAELYEQIRKLKLTIETLREKLDKSETSDNQRTRHDADRTEHPASMPTTSRAQTVTRMQAALSARRHACRRDENAMQLQVDIPGHREEQDERRLRELARRQRRKRTKKIRQIWRAVTAAKLRIRQQRSRNITLRVNIKNKDKRIQEMAKEKLKVQEYLSQVRQLAEAKIDGFAKATKCSDDPKTSPNLARKRDPEATGDVDLPGCADFIENIGTILSKMQELECFLSGDESFDNFIQRQEARQLEGSDMRHGDKPARSAVNSLEAKDPAPKGKHIELSILETGSADGTSISKGRLARRLSTPKKQENETKLSEGDNEVEFEPDAGEESTTDECYDLEDGVIEMSTEQQDEAAGGSGQSDSGRKSEELEADTTNAFVSAQRNTTDEDDNDDFSSTGNNVGGTGLEESTVDAQKVVMDVVLHSNVLMNMTAEEEDDNDAGVTGHQVESTGLKKMTVKEQEMEKTQPVRVETRSTTPEDSSLAEDSDDSGRAIQQQELLKRVSDLLVDKWCLEGQVMALADNERVLAEAKHDISNRLVAAHHELAKSHSDTECRKNNNDRIVELEGNIARLSQELDKITAERKDDEVLKTELQVELGEWKAKAARLETAKLRLEDEVQGWMETVMEVRQGRIKLLNHIDTISDKVGNELTRSCCTKNDYNVNNLRRVFSSQDEHCDARESTDDCRCTDHDKSRVSKLVDEVEALFEHRKIQDAQIEQLTALLQNSNDEKQVLMAELEDESRERRNLQSDIDYLITRV